MKNQLLSKTSLLTILLLMACSDTLLDKVNPNGGTPSSFYVNENQLTAGVNAIYASIQSYNLMGREWFFTNDLRGDEMMAGGGQLEAPRLALLMVQIILPMQLPNRYTQVWRKIYFALMKSLMVL